MRAGPVAVLAGVIPAFVGVVVVAVVGVVVRVVVGGDGGRFVGGFVGAAAEDGGRQGQGGQGAMGNFIGVTP
ncbi:hypothetical protein [Alienimonas sp. DA493]|uniref:hypothetical protein n=1 Tax=Alienimonas sp. DA493 TaxID=3373605 RepID=UPI003754C456